MNKRIFAVILSVAMIFTIAAAAVPASAETSGDFTYTVTDNTATITKYNGSASSVNVPAEIGGYAVSAIGAEAFRGKNMSTVTVAEGIEKIGNYAFEMCRNLKNISLPDSLKSIGSLGFNQCASLTSVNFPKGLESVGTYMFRDCNKLTEITVAQDNENFKAVDNIVFSKDGETLYFYPQALSAESYTVPDGVKTIGATAFVASSLKSVTLPDSLIKISQNAFSESKSLNNIIIPEGVTTIGSSAFSSCSSLSAITVAPSVESIATSAFSKCSANLVISGYKFSAAEKFAANAGITFNVVNDFSDLINTANEKVDALINVTADERESKTDEARAAYDALKYDTPQSYVKNYNYLLLNEKILDAIKNGESVPEFILGDVDNDGNVTVSDVILMRKIIIQGGETSIQLWASDINVDGILTVSDVVGLRSMIMAGIK